MESPRGLRGVGGEREVGHEAECGAVAKVMKGGQKEGARALRVRVARELGRAYSLKSDERGASFPRNMSWRQAMSGVRMRDVMEGRRRKPQHSLVITPLGCVMTTAPAVTALTSSNSTVQQPSRDSRGRKRGNHERLPVLRVSPAGVALSMSANALSHPIPSRNNRCGAMRSRRQCQCQGRGRSERPKIR